MSETAYVTPPSWLIHQLCYPDGSVRLKPLPKQPSYSHYSGRGFSYNRGWDDDRLPSYYRNRQVPTLGSVTIPAGNLKMTDYAFFVGCQAIGAQWRQCRFCLETYFNESTATVHKRAVDKQVPFSHARMLQWMGKLLCARGECICCGKPTSHRRWGYPICFTQQCLVDHFMLTSRPSFSQGWREAKHIIIDELTGPAEARVICR